MPSVADFLIERLENSGIHHIFGVPEGHIFNFSKKISDSDIQFIVTTKEESAAIAADAYARVKGVGSLCISQSSVLKIGHAIACAQAERSPIVVICGSPGIKSRTDFIETTFRHLTCATAVLDNPTTAGYAIDYAFEKMKYHKQPIFIELLQDVADKPLLYDVYKQGTPSAPISNKEILAEALDEVVDLLNAAAHPVILAGVQIARYNLGRELLKFAERTNIPIITTLLSKSVVNEMHPLSAGVYLGAGSNPSIQSLIDMSDCLLCLGVPPERGVFDFVPEKRHIVCSSEILKIKHHSYEMVGFEDFMRSLFKAKINRESFTVDIKKVEVKEFKPRNGVQITVARLFEKINSILNPNLAVVSDVGDSLFGACDLLTHEQNNFLATSYPGMGFAIPAALGLQTACSKVRPIVVLGDGAFQMSCVELGTIVSQRLNPIILVLNNGGYTSSRINGPFNDIHEWDYEAMVKVVCGGCGVVVETEQELNSAISNALAQGSLCIINVKIDSQDISPVLSRMRKAKCGTV